METAGGLWYEVEGEGPPVLFIHGSHIADGFAPLTREGVLQDCFRLIRYIRRGFQGSRPHRGSFSVGQQAADAAALARELELDRFHLVGHSYGAVTAIQLALDAPQQVHSLTLLEPPVMSPAQAVTSQEVLSPLVELYRSGQADAAVDAFMEVVGGPGWDASVERTVPGGPGQARKDATTFFEVELPALGAWSFDEASARRITQPVLYVGGGDSAPFFGEYTQWFCSLVPHTEQVVLPGVSHLLQMQSPDLVADTVARFLAAHPIE